MVKLLLDAGADVNQMAGDEGLPTALFWAIYWGELELVKLFIHSAKHRLDFSMRKYTGETVFDVVRTSKDFATMRKPRHIAKLPLPGRPPVVYDNIAQMLEAYRDRYPEAGPAANANRTALDCAAADAQTASTAAARSRDATSRTFASQLSG